MPEWTPEPREREPDERERLTARVAELEEILGKIIDDFDRRRSLLRGRFLLWLLRKTT